MFSSSSKPVVLDIFFVIFQSQHFLQVKKDVFLVETAIVLGVKILRSPREWSDSTCQIRKEVFFQHSSQRLHKTRWTGPGPLFFVTPSSSGEERQRVAADCQSFSLNRGLPLTGSSVGLFVGVFDGMKTDKRKLEGTGRGDLERLFEGAGFFFCWGTARPETNSESPLK